MQTFDEMFSNHRTSIQKKPDDKILLILEYRLLKALKEPKNRTQLVVLIFMNHGKLDEILIKCQRLALIKKLELNPNKFIITEKGNRVLNLIIGLNKLVDKYCTIPSNEL